MSAFYDAQPMFLTHPLALLKIFNQVMTGLQQDRRNAFIYRDIKPTNIYLADWAHTVAVMGDLGLAPQSEEMMHTPTCTGTLE